MEFAYPLVFWTVGLLALVSGIFLFWQYKKQKKCALRIPMLEDLQQANNFSSKLSLPLFLNRGKWVSFGLTIVFITIALARPQSIHESQKITKNGVDILIALDVSESMLAEDLQPNRIEAAKKYIDEFVSKLQNDRIGLEVFAGKPFTQSPMSFDYNVVRYYLSEISTDTINQQYQGLNGTAIGDAIVAATNRFKNNPDRTKVLVLLTDGEANVGVEPLFAAEHARTLGIKIYTIGLGSKDGAPLVIGKQNGQKIYAKNPDGTVYKSKFDEEALKNIAQVSEGKYFYAQDNKALEKSLETINALEKTEYQTSYSTTTEDHFWEWLLAGFISAIITSTFVFLNPKKI